MQWDHIDTWPNATLSRRGQGPVHRWHIQETGTGDTILLLHGAGGSTHSFRHMIPLLAATHHVVALDLPGQGFTQLGARHRCGLDPMATDVAALCLQEGWTPTTIVGHSAGCAIALCMAQADLSPREQTPQVIGINAALGEFPGLAGLVFPVMAKALAAMPFTASLFSGASANPARVEALIGSTGSNLDAEGLELYRRLVGDRDHVNGTLLMMSQWKLPPLLRALPGHDGPVRFIVGERDKTVPPTVSLDAARDMADATVTNLPGLGHLAHEEKPAEVAGLILELIQEMAG
ncbi:alpha/beta fold hydrolase BchO [uncultured Tateyamaria sp.]|uniref:alpha/beta fold hydrolase BchO n=1 Tax=uncultured Tateyamaria sp. TaxID=455651 RepID=UPI00260F27EB|nr:alpha/beta fold hydrolase BchO [uncultured Tateyamaria sp.]